MTNDPIVPTTGGPNSNEEPLPVLILVICLAVSVFLLLLVIVVCVLKKKRKESEDSAPSSPEAQRPFILGDHQQQLLQQQQQLLQQHQGGKHLHKPLPPTPFMQHQWTNSVYPKMSNPPLVVLTSDHDNSKEFDSVGNQYEVPYAHLLPVGSTTSSNSNTTATTTNNNNRRHFLRSSDCLSSSAGTHPYFEGAMTSRSGPISGFSSDHPSYALKQQQQHLQYFSDYDSQ